ncbi:MAG: hypothetical protein Q8S18_12730 [Bacteroidales bacterium]|nr:hypothetical protein [Bacteroidales bacterium]
MSGLFDFLNPKNQSSKPVSFHLAFQYHDPARRRLVLYNNGKLSCTKITLNVLNEQEVRFSSVVDSIRPGIGVLLNLDDFKDKSGASFTGNLQCVELMCHDKLFKFVVKENKFVPTK